MNQLFYNSVELLKKLIATPSISREEQASADLIEEFFREHAIPFRRENNNIWAKNKYFNPELPTILLNSHHDTVKPNPKWTLNPFEPTITNEGKLFGLGSNDAGASLVALLATFYHFFYNNNLSHNLIIATTAEEEISGKNGIESILQHLPPIAFAIVGEPTEMQLAIAEKGLLVLDCTTTGRTGHAARNEGINALYLALDDLQWVRNFRFPKISPTLGETKITATIIQAGNQHNVIPESCTFTLDVRVTDVYTLNEVIKIIESNLKASIIPRSIRLQPSSIADSHPIVIAGIALGKKIYGSPTLSDQALLPCPSLKIGPGHSERSHTADEFIYLSEIENGISTYIQLLKAVIVP